MARTISNISEMTNLLPVQEAKVMSYSEEFSKINKIKYNLSIVYFVGVAVLLGSLFL